MRLTVEGALAVAAVCCVVHAEKSSDNRLVWIGGEREKRQADEYPVVPKVENALLFIEEKRRNAPTGEAFSLMTRSNRSCDQDCMNGMNLQGSCPMDCRQYYLVLRVTEQEQQIARLTSRVEELEAQNASPKFEFIISLSVVAIVLFGICYFYYKDRRDIMRTLRQEMQQRRVHEHPTSTPHQEAGAREEDVNTYLVNQVDENQVERTI